MLNCCFCTLLLLINILITYFQILSHLTLIDSVENSELEAYLLKILKSGVGPGQDNHMSREEV